MPELGTPGVPLGAADFRPPWLLASPHLQSVLASSGLRRWLSARRLREIERDATEQVIDCGNGARLQGFHTAQRALATPRGLVVLLHGWEGSTRSAYVVNTGARLLREGFDVFRLNFRDHGDTHHLNRDLFHSCRIDEVVGAVRAVQRQFARGPLAIAGFSLGGNFALRVALRAPDAGIELTYALAVCPVISPAAGLFGLEAGPWFYQRYFLHKWRSSLRRKQALFPDVDWFTPAELAGNLRELTRALVLRHTDFGSLENYLDGYSIAGSRLRGLRMPATILTAADDPVIPVADFLALELPPQVELDIAAHGGHCGFVQDLALRSFTENYIAERMCWHLATDTEAVEPASAEALA
ncbi:YheT family hydrolase [Dokdonella soli]|uniref:Alpha/beta fold hydrolase n=1 Tax=Dokdonella soli TaxID=529810 RepID=A0ABP3TKJ4_9GAMM